MRIERLEQQCGDVTIVAGEDGADVADVVAFQKVVSVEIDAGMEGDGAPEDLFQAVGGDLFDQGEDDDRGVGGVDDPEVGTDGLIFLVEARFLELIDGLDGGFERLARG